MKLNAVLPLDTFAVHTELSKSKVSKVQECGSTHYDCHLLIVLLRVLIPIHFL